MSDTSTRRYSAPTPPGFTSIEGGPEKFVLWSARFLDLEAEALRSPVAPVERLDRGGASGLALDMGSVGAPIPARTLAVRRLVDELQLRGRGVVLHDVPADFMTALHMDGVGTRIATTGDLGGAVAILREYDEMRRECTSDRGRRINQLRMPARTLSLAPLSAHARVRLEAAGVGETVRLELLREAYEGMVDVLETALGDGTDLAVSVTVHEGRATITLLDSGPPREPSIVIPEAGGRVDRIHRFRILERHNALVLERDVPGLACRVA